MILKRNFYNRNTMQVAKELIGCFLVREYRGKIIKARITETEAYRGEHDLASHASKGKTARTEIMYGRPGHAYVYMIYGMYFMLNVVTEEKGYPAAVLIRSVEASIEASMVETHCNVSLRLSGPGKLTKFLYIDKSLNNHDLTVGRELWIEQPAKGDSIPNWGLSPQKRHRIIKSPRVGIDYARHCKEWKWNFKLKAKK